MKRLISCFAGCMAFLLFPVHAQFLFKEDFNYTGNLSVGGWLGTSFFSTTEGLVYPATYAGNNVAGSYGANLSGVITGYNYAYHTFPLVGSGSSSVPFQVYVSCILRVDSDADKNGNYCLTLARYNSNIANLPFLPASYNTRLWLKTTGGKLFFGLSFNNSTIQYNTSDYSFDAGKPYLLVLRFYSEGTGASTLRWLQLWVLDPSVPHVLSATGPAESPVIAISRTSASNTFDAILLRHAGDMPPYTLDGLRIFTEWSPAVLPLQLLSFTGKKNDRSIQLQWKTTHEEDLRHFELERSRDGKTFQILQTQPAQNISGIHDYLYTDLSPFAGANYYRLKSVDLDGKSSLSQVLHLDFKEETPLEVRHYSNQRNRILLVHPQSPVAAYIQLIDLSGRVLLRKELAPGVTQSDIAFNGIPGNLYIVSYQGAGRQQSVKFTLP